MRTDKKPQVVHAVSSIKVPEKSSLESAGDSISNKAEIILNKEDNRFYVHDGTEWIPLS